MAYTLYSASQAVARANSFTRYETAMCLQFTRECLNGANRVGLYDANAAWAAAKQKEYGTPPAGAPVYFSGYAHGHIAISLGGGFIRSTDVPTLGRVGRINIGDIERDWGVEYRGWSRDYAGLIIRGLEENSTNYSGVPTLPNSPTPAPPSEEDELMAITVKNPATGEQWPLEQALWSIWTYVLEARDHPQEAADRVWQRTVSRNGQNIAALQELADAKTYAMTAAGAAAILTRLDALSAALPGLPDDADVAALNAKLDELKANLTKLVEVSVPKA